MRSPEPDELDPVGRYVARRIELLTEMMNRWAACTAGERELALDGFVPADAFRRDVEALDAKPAAGSSVAREAG
jgi:hypothetical protein